MWVSATGDPEWVASVLTQLALRLPTNTTTPDRAAFDWLEAHLAQRWPGTDMSAFGIRNEATRRLREELAAGRAPRASGLTVVAVRQVSAWMAFYHSGLALDPTDEAALADALRPVGDLDREGPTSRQQLLETMQRVLPSLRGRPQATRLALLAAAREARARGQVLDPRAFERVLEGLDGIDGLITEERVPANLVGYDDRDELARLAHIRSILRMPGADEAALLESAEGVAHVARYRAGRGRQPEGAVTVTTFRGWHRYLFGDVYETAGELRADVPEADLRSALLDIARDPRLVPGAPRDAVVAGLTDAWRSLSDIEAFESGDEEVRMAVVAWLARDAGHPLQAFPFGELAAATAADNATGDRLHELFDEATEWTLDMRANAQSARRLAFLRSLPTRFVEQQDVVAALARAVAPDGDSTEPLFAAIAERWRLDIDPADAGWIQLCAAEDTVPIGPLTADTVRRSHRLLVGDLYPNDGPSPGQLAIVNTTLARLEDWPALRPGAPVPGVPSALATAYAELLDAVGDLAGGHVVVTDIVRRLADRCGTPSLLVPTPAEVQGADERADPAARHRALTEVLTPRRTVEVDDATAGIGGFAVPPRIRPLAGLDAGPTDKSDAPDPADPGLWRRWPGPAGPQDPRER